MLIMKKRPTKPEFPKNGIYNRYHFPQRNGNAAGRTNYQSLFAPFETDPESFYSDTDPEGSWTGIPRDGEKPLQDADDL